MSVSCMSIHTGVPVYIYICGRGLGLAFVWGILPLAACPNYETKYIIVFINI